MITTATAAAQVRPDGIIAIRIHQGARQSLADAHENLAAVRRLGGSKRAPLLIDMSGALPLDPDVRHFYSDTPLDDSFTAMALVVAASPLSRMMGNVYMRVAAGTRIPIRLFPDEGAAADWLLSNAHG